MCCVISLSVSRLLPHIRIVHPFFFVIFVHSTPHFVICVLCVLRNSYAYDLNICQSSMIKGGVRRLFYILGLDLSGDVAERRFLGLWRACHDLGLDGPDVEDRLAAT